MNPGFTYNLPTAGPSSGISAGNFGWVVADAGVYRVEWSLEPCSLNGDPGRSGLYVLPTVGTLIETIARSQADVLVSLNAGDTLRFIQVQTTSSVRAPKIVIERVA